MASKPEQTQEPRHVVPARLFAILAREAPKGVITTSTFTPVARDYVAGIDSKIVLIDGEQLTQLMIDHNVGVTVDTIYEVKRIDSDYFFSE